MTEVARRALRSASEATRAGDDLASGRRELVATVVAVVALSRLSVAPATWAVAGLLAAAVALAVLRQLRVGERAATGGEDVAPIVPAVAALAAVGIVRLVPVGLALVPLLLVAAVLLDRALRMEHRLAVVPRDATEGERTAVLVQALLVGFLAFLGVAALVPGGLPEPGAPAAAGLSETGLVVLASADALVAGLLGYRAGRLRGRSTRGAVWSALTYAAAIAIAAAAVRATALPRLVGPALLALVFFLWDAFHGATPARRRDPRWIGQIILLLGLGAVVIAWNLALR